MIVVDEIPNQRVHIILGPVQPILNGWLKVKDSPAVKLCRVHLTNLILSTVLTTVDCGKNHSVWMQVVAVELAAVSQLKDTLANLGGCPVHLIKEQQASLLAALLVPVGRIERSHATISRWQTNQVTLGHLRGATLHNEQAKVCTNLIDYLTLTNAVATTEQHRLAHIEYVGNDRSCSLKVDSHCVSLLWGGVVCCSRSLNSWQNSFIHLFF